MKRIKRYTIEKTRYFGKINKAIYKKEEPADTTIERNEDCTISEETQVRQSEELQVEAKNSFALVVVRKLPWYKKLVRNIRNYIIIYRWRKAR